MGLSVSAAAIDINEPHELAKKEKALSGDCSYLPRQAKRLRRAPLHATGAYSSKGSGGRFCFTHSTPFQKTACMVIHVTGGTQGQAQSKLGVTGMEPGSGLS